MVDKNKDVGTIERLSPLATILNKGEE